MARLQFSPPVDMRTFQTNMPGSMQLAKTGSAIHAGNPVQLAGTEIMRYDHRLQIAFRIEDASAVAASERNYVLFEEVDTESMHLSFDAIKWYEAAHNRTGSAHDRNVAANEFVSIMRRIAAHMQPYILATAKSSSINLFDPVNVGIL